jgi:hypothetical protein
MKFVISGTHTLLTADTLASYQSRMAAALVVFAILAVLGSVALVAMAIMHGRAPTTTTGAHWALALRVLTPILIAADLALTGLALTLLLSMNAAPMAFLITLTLATLATTVAAATLRSRKSCEHLLLAPGAGLVLHLILLITTAITLVRRRQALLYPRAFALHDALEPVASIGASIAPNVPFVMYANKAFEESPLSDYIGSKFQMARKKPEKMRELEGTLSGHAKDVREKGHMVDLPPGLALPSKKDIAKGIAAGAFNDPMEFVDNIWNFLTGPIGAELGNEAKNTLSNAFNYMLSAFNPMASGDTS